MPIIDTVHEDKTVPKVSDGDYIGVRSRLIRVDALIRKGDYPNQTLLAKHCGVSSKTIQRDLDYLKFNMEAPLEYDSARRGYHYAEKGFFLPLVFASGTEFQAIKVIGELVSQYEGTPLGNLMEKALERILSVFKNEDAVNLRHLTERICFASEPVVPVSQDVWDVLLTALQRTQQLDLSYLKGGNEPAISRRFDPYGLVVRSRYWFLHGYCHLQKARLNLFAPYIKTATLRDNFFELPDGFNLALYAREGFQGLKSEGTQTHKIILRFVPEAANAVAMHRFAHDQTMKKERDGHAVVTFQASALFQVEREVLSWGDKVEVLKPVELRKSVRDVTNRIAAKYRESNSAAK